MSKKDVFLTILKVAVALTLFVVAIVNYDTLSTLSVSDLTAFTKSVPVIAGVVLGIYFVKALVFVVPASLIYVAVGAIYAGVIADPVMAALTAVGVNLTGILIEVSATYWLGRFLGRDAVYRLLSKRETGRKILEKDLGDKAAVLLAIRAIPAFPIDWISLFYGASGCRFVKYALLSLLGLSWRVILFTIIGDGVFSWIPMDKIILIVICLIPVGVIYYLIKKFVLDPKKKAKAEAAHGEPVEETEEV
ncbi:MAG: VTT domain-containing protein [Clostridia bacterium]|nr:VTT domain-containing protein [Clostridia bacterium]